jgi:cyclopropane-fatty-acyl-phospholipid synthase
MKALGSEVPTSYAGPRSRLERAVCSNLFGLMLDSTRIGLTVHESAAIAPNLACEPEFIVAPPGLWTTLKIMLTPHLAVGESYVAGEWYLEKGDLSDFLENLQPAATSSFRAYYRLFAKLKGFRFFLRQHLLTRYYTRKVKAHYDVDPRIYELFLDEEMLYTCGFFMSSNDDLAQAQQNKLTVTIERLALPKSRCRILDIGCGWGGLARAIVKKYPEVSVCGITISDSQIVWARSKDAKSLTPEQASRIEYRNEDYLAHDRPEYYDGISVVGMIEHVGLSGYADFFRKIRNLLRPEGCAVVHTIVSPNPTYPTNAWIDRHIFTGGHAPSISELVRAAEQQRFRIAGVYIYPPDHYRKTIEAWLENFQSNLNLIKQYLLAHDYDYGQIERFIRTWTFYLSGVRNMFSNTRQGSHQVVQVQLLRL